MNFSSPFLTEQIIAYIGNKRKLLPLIYSAVENTGLEIKSGLKFLDLFSGSGVVSRFAKSLDFEIFVNDWEYYANILSKGYLETNNSDIKKLFGSEEKFLEVLKEINTLEVPNDENQYIAKYYAPKEFDSGAVDFKTERLFYTRKNALTIDKIRNYIEEKFKDNQKIKNLLIANLIYESATHTNTSGVFKSFHKGFGGHGKDALGRILAEIKLNRPVLIDSTKPIHIYQKNANDLVKELKGIDIAYLDPPYNQHQYGSNYHLLNTIAKWDKIPAPLELNEKGVLKEKAAIRHDWVDTRSNYCYREIAENSFADLIENIDAKHILISYSTDGIIPFEKMREICTKKGRLSIVTNEYATYKGGKRSISRQNTNIEFILCIDTQKTNDEESLKKIDAILMRKKLMLLFKQKFSEKKIYEVVKNFKSQEEKFIKNIYIKDKIDIPELNEIVIETDKIENSDSNSKKKTVKKGKKAKKISEKVLVFEIKNADSQSEESSIKKIFVQTKNFFELSSPNNAIELSIEALEEIHSSLENCVCLTKEDELTELISKIKKGNVSINFARKLPSTLKNLAHKKNKDLFYKWLKKIEELESKVPELYEKLCSNIEKVKELAEMRFTS